MTKTGIQVTICLIMIECVIKSAYMFPASTQIPTFSQESVTEHLNNKGISEIDTTRMGRVNDVTQFDTTAIGGVYEQSGEFAESQDENSQNKNYINMNSNQKNPHLTDPTRGNSVKEEINMEVHRSKPTIVDQRRRTKSSPSIDVIFSASNIMEEDAEKSNYKTNVSMDDLFVLFGNATEKLPSSSVTPAKFNVSQGTGPLTISSNTRLDVNIDKDAVKQCITQASNIFLYTEYVFKLKIPDVTMQDALRASGYDQAKLDLVIEQLKTCQNLSIIIAGIQAINDTLFGLDDNMNRFVGDGQLESVRSRYCSLRINVRKLLKPNSTGGCPAKRKSSDLGDIAKALAVLNEVSKQTKTVLEEISHCIKE